MENYLNINKNSWNQKVDPHLKSDFYFVEEFIQGKSSLSEIELQFLQNIEGKKILHLQCHFGQDSISLSRLGAKVTGIDLSDKAIDAAKNLAEKCGTDTKFICCDVYSLPELLDEKFDIVFTSYGTIGWLPDLELWAKVIAHFLKPDGTFVFAEFHPAVWMYDDDFSEVKYSYFNTGAITETYEGSYADQNAPIVQEYVMWNHSISEVVNSLLANGLSIETLNEFNFSPWPCFKHNQEIEKGRYIIPQFEGKMPMVYAIKANKKPS